MAKTTQSEIEPTKESLEDVDIELVEHQPDHVTLRCGSCGLKYRVYRKKIGEINWYACPNKVHKPHKWAVPA